MDQLNILFIVE